MRNAARLEAPRRLIEGGDSIAHAYRLDGPSVDRRARREALVEDSQPYLLKPSLQPVVGLRGLAGEGLD